MEDLLSCSLDILLIIVVVLMIAFTLIFKVTSTAEVVAENENKKVRANGPVAIVFALLGFIALAVLFYPRFQFNENWCGKSIRSTPIDQCIDDLKTERNECKNLREENQQLKQSVKKYKRTIALAEKYYYRSTPKFPNQEFLVTEGNKAQAYMLIGELQFIQNNTSTGITASRKYIVEVPNKKNKDEKIEIRPKEVIPILEWKSPKNHVFSSPEVNEVVYRLETYPQHKPSAPKNMGYFIGEPKNKREINGKITAIQISGVMDYLMTTGKWISADKVLEMIETDLNVKKNDNPYIKAESIAQWFKNKNFVDLDELEKNYVFCELNQQNNCKKLSELVK